MSVDNSQDLLQFTTCDVADALRVLGQDGFLPDLQLYAPTGPETCVVGPVHTVQMARADDKEAPRTSEDYVDTAPSGSIIVISVPEGVISAVWGGLRSARAKAIGVKAAVIDGRCRDVHESRQIGLPVFARATSCYGAGGFTRVSTIGQPLDIRTVPDQPPVHILPDDLIMADINGVLRLRRAWIDDILDLCRRQSKIDELCMRDLEAGHPIKETFARHRGK
ncbi:RraA-like protein [Thamnocephalis sphaerospora]|uniref:RraA-like protein n=1 Tax=Thamnocephalis sphaerospora TaxID=78915 RepID=A0A4P9XKQ3_9FUNG|nr:RraA-like protein [Thamnocephalis sphaerospora]|eukprot:RKP06342.1 RraA-like protein [Thamnocephalis sphaerospora]